MLFPAVATLGPIMSETVQHAEEAWSLGQFLYANFPAATWVGFGLSILYFILTRVVHPTRCCTCKLFCACTAWIAIIGTLLYLWMQPDAPEHHEGDYTVDTQAAQEAFEVARGVVQRASEAARAVARPNP